jgi:hypothetical protein
MATRSDFSASNRTRPTPRGGSATSSRAGNLNSAVSAREATFFATWRRLLATSRKCSVFGGMPHRLGRQSVPVPMSQLTCGRSPAATPTCAGSGHLLINRLVERALLKVRIHSDQTARKVRVATHTQTSLPCFDNNESHRQSIPTNARIA